VAKQDMEYCQEAFVTCNITNASGQQSKSGHIIAVSTSAQSMLEVQFHAWEADHQQMFSPQSLHSLGYHYDKAFTYDTLTFLIQCSLPALVEPKRPINPTSLAPDAK